MTMLLWRAVMMSVLIYGVSFACVIVPWKGVAQDFQSRFVFWGSILRPQDLLPVGLVDSLDANIRPVAPALAFLKQDHAAWRAQVVVDKPAEQRSLSGFLGPMKFSTQRVELDNVLQAPDAGIDLESHHVSLRMPLP